MFSDYSFYQIAWYFTAYSFLGWCMEVVYCTVTSGKVVNRGFLNGPVCPIYGFGMLGILVLLRPLLAVNTWPYNIALFVCGAVLASSVELLVGWGMLKLFHARWWDYSDWPFNLNGFICLGISLCWGGGTLVACRILHPLVHTLTIRLLPSAIGWWLLAIIYLLFAIDTVASVLTAVHLDHDLEELDRITQRMESLSEKLSTDLGTRALETDKRLDNVRLQARLASYELRDAVENAGDRLEDATAERRAALELRAKQLRSHLLDHRFGGRRLLRAFPRLNTTHSARILHQLQDELESRRRH